MEMTAGEWADFQSDAKPAIQEFGKSFLLNRSDTSAIVPIEPLTTVDGYVWTANYGRWNPDATISLFRSR